MLRGLATISFWADDVLAARAWYSELLGIPPYFERPDAETPAYIEFRLGDYQHELGIIDRKYAPPGAASAPGGVITYWHVDDVAATLERLTAMGRKCTNRSPIVGTRAGSQPRWSTHSATSWASSTTRTTSRFWAPTA
jgi:predicted enzyme related to lactoylglutathione lyase